MKLDGKVVLITGPARGIGAETARQLARRGARLALVGMEPERLSALAAELGDGHVWFPCDATDQGALERAVAGTVAALGGIDVVIANAGIACNGTVAQAPVEAQVRTIQVNLIGVLRTVQCTVASVSERRGHFLLVSSAAAFSALPGMGAYAASKAGVEHFGNVLRLEMLPRGVTVGVLHPGWIDTDLVRDAEQDMASFRAARRSLPGPFGKTTTVEACAEAVVAGIEARRRRIFVPRALAPFAALRMLLVSRLAERAIARELRRRVPELERETDELGRAFGEHSVGEG